MYDDNSPKIKRVKMPKSLNKFEEEMTLAKVYLLKGKDRTSLVDSSINEKLNTNSSKIKTPVTSPVESNNKHDINFSSKDDIQKQSSCNSKCALCVIF